MKKNFLLLAAGVFAGSIAFAQKKAPPPPPRVDLTHFTPPPPPALPDDYQDFLKRNPTVDHLSWSEGKTVHVYLKNGAKETYQLNTQAGKGKAEQLYGQLPTPPPPPPPVVRKAEKLKAPPPPPEVRKAEKIKAPPPPPPKEH
jgi:hypothetical protein